MMAVRERGMVCNRMAMVCIRLDIVYISLSEIMATMASIGRYFCSEENEWRSGAKARKIAKTMY
jgi:hypothetical protein